AAYKSDWVDWYSFFGTTAPEGKYPTLAEASAAAIKLLNSKGVELTSINYHKRFKADPRLPSQPHIVYKSNWVDWYSFLGSNKYPTLAEASEATIKLLNSEGVELSGLNYRKHYKADPRLRSDPYYTYKNDWVDWYSFFGTTEPNKYPTLAEASEAAIKLLNSKGVELIGPNYRKNYKADPRLPSQPYIVYKSDWVGWYSFFGTTEPDKYPTLAEASEAAIKLLNSKGVELIGPNYRKNYKADPRLPLGPNVTYKNDWVGWYSFFGTTAPEGKYPTLAEASAAAIRLLNSIGVELSGSNYEKHYKADPKLRAAPGTVYESDWVDWYSFLGTTAPEEKYPTLAEASAAAIKLLNSIGVELTGPNYQKHCRADPRLPVSPHTFYKSDWVDGSHYLNPLNYYHSPQEAYDAAINIVGIREKLSLARYEGVRITDSRLPAKPHIFYRLGSWQQFIACRFYLSIDECAKAALKVVPEGCRTVNGYAENYKKDPRLPSRPDNIYSAWESWTVFYEGRNAKPYTIEKCIEIANENALWDVESYEVFRKKIDSRLVSHQTLTSKTGNDFRGSLGIEYFTLEEVKGYCQKNRIATMPEYKDHAKKHPRLKVSLTPKSLPSYTNFNDVKWQREEGQELEDLGLERWCTIYRDYRNDTPELGAAAKIAIVGFFAFFGHFFIKNKEIGSLFSKAITAPDLNQFLDSDKVHPSKKTAYLTHIYAFLTFAFNRSCTAEDEDESSALVVLEGYKMPYVELFSKVSNNKKTTSNQTVKPALPYGYIVKARDALVPERAQNFSDLRFAHTLNESDWFEVSEEVYNQEKDTAEGEKQGDPDCIVRPRSVTGRSKGRSGVYSTIYEMWCPARAMALYFLITHPHRGQQICWMDSGETDKYRLNYNQNAPQDNQFEWVKNTSPLRKKSLNKRDTGIFWKTGRQNEFGMFTNTNKTGQPFTSVYFPLELSKWLVKLRDWQEKYNSISEPTSWGALTFNTANKPSERVLNQRGATSFLFRLPKPSQLKGGLTEGSPITPDALVPALAKLLRHIEDENLPLTYVQKGIVRSYYTKHAMRVSLITAYVVHGDVPLEVMVKIVGHATILMTLHYTKIEQGEIKRTLDNAEKKALQNHAKQVEDAILQGKINSIKSELIISESSVLHTSDYPLASLQFTDYGICPMAFNGCDSGGTEVNANGKEVPAQVKPGWLGEKNCFRCKHFVTGSAFIAGLAAKGNEIASAKLRLSQVIQDLESECDQLMQDASTLEGLGEKSAAARKLSDKKLIERDIESKTSLLDLYMCDIFAIYKLIQQSIELLSNTENTKGTKGVPLLLNNPGLSIAIDEVDEYQVLNEVCQNREVFVSGMADHDNLKRAQMLDRMLRKNGMEPALFELPPAVQLKVGNQMTNLMLERLRGDWNGVNALIKGLKPLNFIESQNNSKEMSLADELKMTIPPVRRNRIEFMEG
ncbi:VPA1269 family protein, partial [Shewanella atlantica]